MYLFLRIAQKHKKLMGSVHKIQFLKQISAVLINDMSAENSIMTFVSRY